jgi:cobalt/nickel transport system permease protein
MEIWNSEVDTTGGLFSHLDPRTKLIGFAVLLTAVMATPAAIVWMWAGTIPVLLLLGVVARVSLKKVAVRLLFVMPLLLFIFVSLIIFKPAPRDGGTLVLWGLVLKTAAVYLCLALFSLTTGVNGLLRGLRDLRFPSSMVTVLSFSFRYLFLFLNEARRLRWAIVSRGGGSGSRRQRVTLAGSLMTQVFTRVFDRSEWIYAAMLSRGFAGRIPLGGRLDTAQKEDVVGGDDVNVLVLEVKDLNFSYPDGTPALRGIDLELRDRETVGLVGPNGAGKSTLMLHLNGVFRGDGLVRVMGLDMTKKNVRAIRRQVGIVFQDPNDQLFMPSVKEDVAFGPLCFGMEPDEVDNRVEEILRRMDLLKIKDKPPHHLSLGERKKAALATVLVMQPRIVILDEPSVSLDPQSRRQFIDLVKEIDAATLIVSHDLDLVYELCGRTLLMEKGKIIASDATDKILADQELLQSHQLESPLSIQLATLEAQLSGRN